MKHEAPGGTDGAFERLVVAIPTHDMRAVVQSLLEIGVVAHLLQRPLQFVVSGGSNIPRTRNTIVHRLRHIFPTNDRCWVLWLDSDIEIPAGQASAIQEAILWAEAHQSGIVANHRMTTGQNVLMANRDPSEVAHHLTDDELQQMEPFAEIGMAGLGLAYVPQPIHYHFYADEIGEDMHFWWDNPDIHLHYAKDIHLGHRKMVVLF